MKKMVVLIFIILGSFIYSEGIEQKLSLQGKGIIKLAPDRADIDFTVLSINEDLSKATENNRKIMEQVDNELKNLSIDKKDIKTKEYSLNRAKENEKDTVSKYYVRNRFSITVSDLEKIGSIIAALEKSGVNEVSGLNFYSSKEDEMLKEAMVLAYKDAYGKAQAVGQEAGYKNIKPLNIEYDYNYMQRQPYMMSLSAMPKQDVQIYSPESLDLQVNVRTIFLLENGKK
ncbi:SIMPL domain-containing protein [Cetobacterium sp. 2A]|uniref:SIMPL domain-containing protein n=1 Tax=Cetobacterium sp. 2A TaxID=2754723 RepID=UPI00163C6F67|nr:SIMPL domain-containing protein [Cetobacterium sp. 2A]